MSAHLSRKRLPRRSQLCRVPPASSPRQWPSSLLPLLPITTVPFRLTGVAISRLSSASSSTFSFPVTSGTQWVLLSSKFSLPALPNHLLSMIRELIASLSNMMAKVSAWKMLGHIFLCVFDSWPTGVILIPCNFYERHGADFILATFSFCAQYILKFPVEVIFSYLRSLRTFRINWKALNSHPLNSPLSLISQATSPDIKVQGCVRYSTVAVLHGWCRTTSHLPPPPLLLRKGIWVSELSRVSF